MDRFIAKKDLSVKRQTRDQINQQISVGEITAGDIVNLNGVITQVKPSDCIHDGLLSGRNIRAYGDSITAGQGVAEYYVKLISEFLASEFSNYAVPGAGGYFQNVKSLYRSRAFDLKNDAISWMFGINTIRTGANTTNYLSLADTHSNYLSNQVRTLVVRHFADTVVKSSAANGSLGSWDMEIYPVPIDNDADLSKTDVHTPFISDAAHCVGSGNKYEFEFVGDSFFVSLLANFSYDRHFTDVNIYIDGVFLETVSPVQCALYPSALRSAFTYCKKGLVFDKHKVTLESASTLAGDGSFGDGHTLVNCHGTLKPLKDWSPLLLFDILNVFGVSHIDASFYADKAKFVEYLQIINDAVFDATNDLYESSPKLVRISAELVEEDFVDGLHPNEQGHQKIFEAFINA